MVRDHISLLGKTPVINLSLKNVPNINIYCKLEFYNPTGSVKDRSASYLLNKLLTDGTINKETTIIESSSGNMGIALSAYCRKYNLKSIIVVDPHILPINEMIIKNFNAKIIKVTVPDKNGGYLLTRIEKVNELLNITDNIYWTNQYENPLIAEAYYSTLGEEICNQIDRIDYIFIGVSSGGTITGISRKVKERYPGAKVIAVDIDGSVIFGGPPKRRYIPGIGSSKVPKILSLAKIDDVVMISEKATIKACYELLSEYQIFAGGSSGSVFAAIKQYFTINPVKEDINVVTILPDKGERYANTIYDANWITRFE